MTLILSISRLVLEIAALGLFVAMITIVAGV
jgi:hypothetical protein